MLPNLQRPSSPSRARSATCRLAASSTVCRPAPKEVVPETHRAARRADRLPEFTHRHALQRVLVPVVGLLEANLLFGLRTRSVGRPRRRPLLLVEDGFLFPTSRAPRRRDRTRIGGSWVAQRSPGDTAMSAASPAPDSPQVVASRNDRPRRGRNGTSSTRRCDRARRGRAAASRRSGPDVQSSSASTSTTGTPRGVRERRRHHLPLPAPKRSVWFAIDGDPLRVFAAISSRYAVVPSTLSPRSCAAGSRRLLPRRSTPCRGRGTRRLRRCANAIETEADGRRRGG